MRVQSEKYKTGGVNKKVISGKEQLGDVHILGDFLTSNPILSGDTVKRSTWAESEKTTRW